ncbi:glutamate--cysteine ligase [Leuconostoc palmae]|uniref:glutamate--cysteine ligase n=1 Tax=Leuconostoc palmae TaxID=501487 RepID=UPI001C7DF773|nr:glutamate--cysteine ligase [Leuconostoc palmae]
MSDTYTNIKKNQLITDLFSGTFGIEIEEHRIQISTRSLSQHPHADILGNRRTQPYFQTDFSESQEELVTAPQFSTQKALTHLHELQFMLSTVLANDELIWPLSMPPHLSVSDIDYLKTHFERSWYQDYRDVLLKRYGPFQHIMAGVHVNFSPTDSIVNWFQEQQQLNSIIEAQNTLFFQIAQQIVHYRWFITYLFGAAPVSENPDDKIPNDKSKIARSWRASNFGFTNHSNITIDYLNLTDHITQIKEHLADGKLYDKSEFYGPVRLKSSGNLDQLLANGAKYLEFRMFDIDPFAIDGISQLALDLLQLLIIDAIINPQTWDNHSLRSASDRNHVVALQNPSEQLTKENYLLATQLMIRLKKIVADAPIESKDRYHNVLHTINTMLQQPLLTISGQLLSHIDNNNSLITFGMMQATILNSKRKLQNTSNILSYLKPTLRETYIQAHYLGWSIEVLESGNHLKVSHDNKSFILSEYTDLLTL